MSRKCGACTLCCTTLAVPELDKPNGVRCKHLTEGGCGIYEDRPESCKAFKCAWLRGAGDGLYERPDFTGGVLTVEKDESPDDLGEAFVIYGDPNGKDPLHSRYVLLTLMRAINAGETGILVIGDERRLFTTSDSPHARRVAELEEDEK